MTELCPLPACRHPKQYHRDVAYANQRGCSAEGCPCPGWTLALASAAKAAGRAATPGVRGATIKADPKGRAAP